MANSPESGLNGRLSSVQTTSSMAGLARTEHSKYTSLSSRMESRLMAAPRWTVTCGRSVVGQLIDWWVNDGKRKGREKGEFKLCPCDQQTVANVIGIFEKRGGDGGELLQAASTLPTQRKQ